MRNANGQNGMSLIELMVAMTIGLVLTGATVAIYLENRQTSRTAETLARMQEDARYAMEVLGRDIKMAGYYGLVSESAWINGTTTSTAPLPAIGGDCLPGWYTDLAVPLWAINNTNPYPTCINNNNYVPNSDVLVVRRASTQLITNLASVTAGSLLLRNSPSAGQLYTNAANPPTNFSGTTQDQEIFARAYYLRPNYSGTDGIPTLAVENLEPGGGVPTVSANVIVPGVEQFQVQLGIDSNDDGSVDYYRDPEAVAAPNAIDVDTIVAVRIWLLMRAENAEVGVDDQNTYTLGSMSFTPLPDKKDYRRVLFSTTFKTRNSS